MSGLFDEIRLVSRARDWRGRSRTPRSAEQWATPHEPRQFPTAWARTKPARVVREGVQRGVLRPLVWTQTRPQVHGADRLDGVEGPVIVIANHASHLDAPLILNALPAHMARRTAVGAAADYFFDARWRASLTALVFNAFPIERSGSRRPRMIAPDLLADGWNILMFPEGTRSQDGWMRSFRRGAAQMACQNGVPVVPVAVRGAYSAMPRGRNWPKAGRPSGRRPHRTSAVGGRGRDHSRIQQPDARGRHPAVGRRGPRLVGRHAGRRERPAARPERATGLRLAAALGIDPAAAGSLAQSERLAALTPGAVFGALAAGVVVIIAQLCRSQPVRADSAPATTPPSVTPRTPGPGRTCLT
jgi:1-acyl-sn-glycerol-3-phosphate acyltransferase